MAVNAQQLIDRYKRGVQGGGTNYAQGVAGKGNLWKTNASSDAAETNYRNGVMRAANDKTRQKALAQKSGADWESAAAGVGAQNYAASATRAGDNYAKVATHVAAAADAAQSAAAQIPRGTIQENFNRAQAAAVAAHRYWASVNGTTPQV